MIPKKGYGKLIFDSAALLFDNLEQFNTTDLQEPENMEPLGQGMVISCTLRTSTRLAQMLLCDTLLPLL